MEVASAKAAAVMSVMKKNLYWNFFFCTSVDSERWRNQAYNIPHSVVLVVKNPPAKAGDIRDAGLIPGSERSPGERHGNPLQCSCLENPMDRGACWATVHGLAELDTTEVI